MAQQPQTNRPAKINFDKAKKYLAADEASYLLNHDVTAVIGKSTPLPANSPLCEVDQPEGENYTIGTHYSPLTNETYSWVYNSNGANYLQRISGNGSCEIVYSGECLPLSAAPEHGIFDWRAVMRLEKICHNRSGKELIWVDGTDNDIFCLDVEASIATNSFTTPFFDRCPDPCAPLKLCVPDICGCIHGEFAPLQAGQENLTNHLIDVGVKIIVRHIYYDQRASEWSIPSTLFYQDIKGGCFGGDQGFSRCLKLTIPLGNPLVDKIEIGYSTDNGASWLLSDTIEKYASYTSANQYWYERELNPDLQLTYDGCSFYYFFCNDKQCQAIDPKEVARVYNPLPRAPQGLIEIKDGLGFYNYKQGNCPIDKIETDKFKVALNCDNEADCVTDYVEVTVRAIIHRYYGADNQFIYRNGGTTYNDVDDESDAAHFGGVNVLGGTSQNFDQKFSGKKRNFTAYIEGTSYESEMFQWRAFDGFTQRTKAGIISGISNQQTAMKVYGMIAAGYFFYQETTFKVPKGTKGFIRLTSHDSSAGDPNTSTFVSGTADITQYRSYNGGFTIDDAEHELYFDTCAGSVDLTKCFIIQDNAETDSSTAFNGYVIDAAAAPLAGVEVWTPDNFFLCKTDHNGFYHFTLREGSNPQPVEVRMEKDCATFGAVHSIDLPAIAGSNVSKDIRVTDVQYANSWYAWASVRVADCDGNNISGIPVAVSGAKFRYTDESGTALIPIRNYANRARQLRAIAMDSGGCFLMGCDGKCNPCASSEVVTAPPCFDVAHFIPRNIHFTDIVLNTKQKSLSNKGLKKSGRYGFGIVAMGDCGRISSVYNAGYLDIPRLQENSSEDFCSFSYNANGIKLPEWVKCLQVVRTANLNPFELQWVIDKVERTGDGKIILTTQSLNDYKERYNFQVNTVYQYQQGDRLEFINNGDGKVFKTEDHGVLNYAILSPFNDGTTDNTEADFFNQLIIQDDGKLNELVAGAKIELQRAKQCTDEPAYFSICVSLPVEDGEVINQTGTFETFDTYRVTRQIANFPPQSFEHFAPSDFWLSKMDDTGKSYFVNKYENERRYGRNISLNSPTQFNRFGDLVKIVGSPEQGDIIAMSISDAKVVMGICENDNFLLEVADDILRVNASGEIVGIPADRIIGDPQAKLGGVYGCRYEDAGSVLFGESYTLWADVKRDAYVKHGYGMNRDASKGPATDTSENKLRSYFKTKFRQLQIVNSSVSSDLDKVRFITGVNRFNNTIALTIKSLRDANINNEEDALKIQNETIIYNPYSDDFLTFASYTPEAYSVLNIPDDEGCAFISYSNGIPYLHPIVTNRYLEFYGTTVDWCIEVAINKFPEEIKVGISIEVQSEVLWYISKVSIDKPEYDSEIPAIRWKKEEDKFNASFLGNKNSRKGLFGGELPRGYFISCLFKRDNTQDLRYNTIDINKRLKYSEIDLILFKFLHSAQSGFVENL